MLSGNGAGRKDLFSFHATDNDYEDVKELEKKKQALVSKLEKAIGQIPLPTGEVARASGPGEGYHIY